MKQAAVRSSFTMRLICTVLLALQVGTCRSQENRQQRAPSLRSGAPLKQFLQKYLKAPLLHPDKSTRYIDVLVDLNGDGVPEVIVYLTGQSWCGSGGCVLLVLSGRDADYRVVTRLTIARSPIRVLTTSAKGWNDISVWVQGGGIKPGYEALLRFDGQTYPTNPSVPPAQRIIAEVPGKIVLRSSQGSVPLYP